jgi:L-ascorbate metabolism protein UlaG (beta-lactamase superfamily)
VVDPFDKSIGLKRPKLKADVLLISHDHPDHNDSGSVTEDPYVIDLPGEYESHGVMIEGIPTYHDDKEGADRGRNTVFAFTLDGIHFVHLGDLGHQLDDAAVERIGQVDVLMIPVGGTFTITAKGAVDVISKLQPRVVIPMHYDVPGVKLPKKIDPLDAFLKEAGSKVIKLDKSTWKVKQKDLPNEETEIVVFPNPA